MRCGYIHSMKATPAEKHTYANELYLHMVAGRMLFPRSEDNFMAYLCLGIDSVLSKSMRDGMPKQNAFTGILSVVESLFPQEYVPNMAWDRFQWHIRNARFPRQQRQDIPVLQTPILNGASVKVDFLLSPAPPEMR